MGLFKLLFRGVSGALNIETAKNGLLAKYFFNKKCSEEQKLRIMTLANQQFDGDKKRMGMRDNREVEDLPDRVKYLFYAYIMNYLDFNPLYPKFFWKKIGNPFESEYYEDSTYTLASEVIKKDYGISVSEK